MHLVSRERRDNGCVWGEYRRNHYMASLRPSEGCFLEALQVLVGLRIILHIPAGDIIIGKSCPPLDAKT